jgi:RNA polymerase sigma factor (sigma-70 family)
MTNEELAARIKAGETELMPILWEQTKRFAYKMANKFYWFHYDRCKELGVELADLEQEAYLGIHIAVEKYKPEKGVKFLTYAAYRLKSSFTIAAHLHNGKDRYHETKFEDVTVCEGNAGEDVTLEDTIADTQAEEDMQDFIEQEARQDYLSNLHTAFQEAFASMRETQRGAVTACLVLGMSGREYARQRGVSHQAVYTARESGLRKLRANTQLAAYAV